VPASFPARHRLCTRPSEPCRQGLGNAFDLPRVARKAWKVEHDLFCLASKGWQVESASLGLPARLGWWGATLESLPARLCCLRVIVDALPARLGRLTGTFESLPAKLSGCRRLFVLAASPSVTAFSNVVREQFDWDDISRCVAVIDDAGRQALASAHEPQLMAAPVRANLSAARKLL
jgi:hypothetical protein